MSGIPSPFTSATTKEARQRPPAGNPLLATASRRILPDSLAGDRSSKSERGGPAGVGVVPGGGGGGVGEGVRARRAFVRASVRSFRLYEKT